MFERTEATKRNGEGGGRGGRTRKVWEGRRKKSKKKRRRRNVISDVSRGEKYERDMRVRNP